MSFHQFSLQTELSYMNLSSDISKVSCSFSHNENKNVSRPLRVLQTVIFSESQIEAIDHIATNHVSSKPTRNKTKETRRTMSTNCHNRRSFDI